MVLAYVEGLFSCDCFKEEMIGEPAKHYKHWARNGGDAEDDELWVVSCALADIGLGDGRLVAQLPCYHVDEEQTACNDPASDLKEDAGRKETLYHL